MSPDSAQGLHSPDVSTGNLEQIHIAALLEHAPFRIYFKDRASRFLAVGRQKLLRHGFTRQSEIIGKSDADFFSAEHARRAREDEEQIMKTGQMLVGADEKIVWPNGDISWGRATKLPLRDEDGIVIGTFGYTEDITREKELAASLKNVQGALMDASRMAGMAEVATGVLHNVGNVLNSLNVSTTVLSTGLRQSKAESLARVSELLRTHETDLAAFLTADPKGKKIPDFLGGLAAHFSAERDRLLAEIEALQKNVDHIKEIVSMQQSFASMAGLTEPLEPAVLLEDALRMNQAALSRAKISVAREFAPVPTIVAEKGKVLQILVNLIRNSRQACEESGRADPALTLRVAAGESGRVLLSVTDNGIGIPEENLVKIFQHGFTTKAKGHGFGIHSSANAAREMKGSLSVSSPGRGQGATFTLDLPVADATVPPGRHLPL
jgi:PAS domain S-box-containing protein